MLTETTPPMVTPEMDAEIARHLRLSGGFDGDQTEDARAAFLAALSHLETSLGLCLAPRGFLWSRRLSASTASVEAPIAPLRSLVSVSRQRSDGGLEPLDLSLFSIEAGGCRTRIRSRIQFFDVLQFEVEAGFGASWTDTPADLRRAVLILTADHFDRRHGDVGAAPPAAVASLVGPWRPIRLTAGAR